MSKTLRAVLQRAPGITRLGDILVTDLVTQAGAVTVLPGSPLEAVKDPVVEVGEGIRIGSVALAGHTIGIIENPVFSLPPTPEHDGPGR